MAAGREAHLLGVGTCVPDSVAQREALEFALRTHRTEGELDRVLPLLYRRSGVERRGSVLAGEASGEGLLHPAGAKDDAGPGTAARLERYAREAAVLAETAAQRALDDAGVNARQVTHLITVSCTGFEAPGVDAKLIRKLGLWPEVERTCVGFMGCHGAINALRLARASAAQDPEAVALVVAVEVCSVHFNYSTDAEKLVANALFADGAAAAVVGRAASDRRMIAPLSAFGSCLVPETADAMSWAIGDNGFEMTLSARVPDILRSALFPWVTRWLSRHGLSLQDVASWAVHPGGPRILTAAAESLGIDERAIGPSRRVLAEHGNMSSPTVLFILDRIRRNAGAGRSPWPCVMLAFGPGLVIEAAVVGERE